MTLLRIFSFSKFYHFPGLKSSIVFISALSLIFLLQFADLNGQGDLLITPRRVVFEGTKRSMDLNLANTGTGYGHLCYICRADQDERGRRF